MDKIKNQDIAFIESKRNSLRKISSFKENKNQTPDKAVSMTMNGKDFLYSEVEGREKAVNLITK